MFLTKIIKVYTGEGKKIALFFFLGLLAQFGVIVGLSMSDALFLGKLGAEKLSYFFVIFPFIMLVFVTIYSHLVSKYGIRKLFLITLIAQGIGGLALAALSFITDGAWFYYVLKSYAYAWFIAGYSIFWSFVDEYFSVIDAKRLFPLLSGGLTCGGILGSFIVVSFHGFFPPAIFFSFWGFSAIASSFVFLLVKKNFSSLEQEKNIEKNNLLSQIKYIFQYSKNSKFLYYINFIFFLIILLSTFNEFEYSSILSENRNEEQLIATLGRLYLITNVLNLFINFFFFSRLVVRIGITNTAFIQPFVYLIAFCILLIDKSDFSAFIAFFAYHGFLVSIDFNNWNFLFNAFPYRIKKLVRFFVEGLVDPVATALGGGFLILFAATIGSDTIIRVCIIIAVLAIIMTLVLKGEYLKAMVSLLKEKGLDFSRNIEYFVKKLGPKDINFLEKKLSALNPNSFRISFFTLWRYDNMKAIEIICSIFLTVPKAKQHLFVHIFSFILRQSNYQYTRYILEWLEDNKLDLSSELLSELSSNGLVPNKTVEEMITSDKLEERKSAIITYWNSWDLDEMLISLEEINKMTKSKDINEMVTIIQIIGKTKQSKFIHTLVNYINHPSEKIRKETVIAIKNLIDESSDYVIPILVNKFMEVTSEERLDILNILKRISDSNMISPIFLLSDKLTPFERRKVVNVAINMKLQSVPMIVSIFNGEQYPYVARTLAAKALSSISFSQFNSLFSYIVHTEISKAYHALYSSKILYQYCSENPEKQEAIIVLAKFYSSISNIIVNFVLEVLGLAGQIPSVELISNFLLSDNIKEKGNAIETIEQGIDRKFLVHLIPLVDSRSIEDKINYYKEKILPNMKNANQDYSVDNIIDSAFYSPFLLETAIAIQAYWGKNGNESLPHIREKAIANDSPICKNILLSVMRKSVKNVEINLIDTMYYIIQNSFLSNFSINEIQDLAQVATKKVLRKGTVLFKNKNSTNKFYLIIDGNVKASSRSNKFSKASFSSFSILGLKEVLSSVPYTDSYTCSGKVTLLEFEKDSILKIIRGYPKVGIKILGYLWGV